MSEQTAYRIVEIKYGHPHCLFHGLPHAWGRRSRFLPINTWIKAEQKMVVDGGKQEPYLSGFNVLLNREDCETYLGRFKASRNLRVVKIKVRGKLRKKESNKGGVMLAEEMYLPWPQEHEDTLQVKDLYQRTERHVEVERLVAEIGVF